MDSLVSVIIPTYNRINVIMNSINSILNQTYKNFECIIVDDCSNDDTEKIIKHISDKRIKYYKLKEQSGACVARNYGMSIARGSYLAFNDSDDVWESNKLKKQIDFIIRTNSDFVFSGMNRKSLVGKTYYSPNVNFECDDNFIQLLLKRNVAGTPTIFINRNVANNIKFDKSLKMFQDWDFILQAYEKGFKIGYIPEPLVNAYEQNNSISISYSIAECRNKIIEKYYNLYLSYPKSLSEIYMYQAREYRENDFKMVSKYLCLSMRYNFKIKTFIKFILNIFHLWKK